MKMFLSARIFSFFCLDFCLHVNIGSRYMALDAWGIWVACYHPILSHAIFAGVSPLALHEGDNSLCFLEVY